MFSKIDWTMNVLLVEETKTVDIPFEPNDAWVELTPGFEIMVEAAATEEGKYQYKLKTQYDSTRVGYLMSGSIHLWNDESLPPAAILSMAILNAEGKSVKDVSGGNGGFSSGSGASGSSTQMSGTMSGSGSCSAVRRCDDHPVHAGLQPVRTGGELYSEGHPCPGILRQVSMGGGIESRSACVGLQGPRRVSAAALDLWTEDRLGLRAVTHSFLAHHGGVRDPRRRRSRHARSGRARGSLSRVRPPA